MYIYVLCFIVVDGGDRTRNHYDSQNHNKFSRKSLCISNQFARESPKFQRDFHRVNRSLPSDEWETR